MKTKKKKIIICSVLSFIIVLLISAVCFFQFTPTGYRMTIRYRGSFERISDNIYVNKNYSGNKTEVIQLVNNAKERVDTFYGGLRCLDDTTIIICDDEKLISKLGGDHDTITTTFPFKRNYISVSDKYLNIDILAHELTHAELHTRLSTKALKTIPVWFDEGIAIQNDYREQYSVKAWVEQTDNGKNTIALHDMDTRSEFYAGTKEDRRFRYLNAKHEVSEWMSMNKQNGLIELIDELNAGEDFDSAYFK